ncbi:MAG TPA: chemotaxis protein CheB [Rhodoblastus sp.]|nr:chemotaxis protein CheB [Rhodoblastus sp.]
MKLFDFDSLPPASSQLDNKDKPLNKNAPNGDLLPSHTPVCAIGASAGGLNALRNFFTSLSPTTGAAFVVIVHLAPQYPSALGEILASMTAMPVEAVEDQVKLEPNRVYVIPPDRELVIDGDDLRARPFSEPPGRRHPIDMFFESLAAGRSDVVALVLSGSGSDGESGVRAVKQAGGLVFVQDPAEAEFAMMPNQAIATGVADVIAPAAELARRFAETMRRGQMVRRASQEELEGQLVRILDFLRRRLGHDFSSYKRPTVLRRIARRVQVARQDTFADYYRFLQENPDEARALLADLLISVTSFFRDADSFAALTTKAVEPIFAALEGEGPIRVWVVGCASGEEAYSIAMVLLEEADRRGVHPSIQIFASDIDESALAVAREGCYPATIRDQMSEERLRRFFVADGLNFRVRKELRDLTLFVAHSALKDPPFIKLDLICCRNFLIYLQRALQRQLLNLFHYALKPGGFLFLGAAESVDVATGLFSVVDRDARIFAPLPQAKIVASALPQLIGTRRFAAGDALKPGGEPAHGARGAHAAALERAAPPSVLVDGLGRIVHLSASAGRFFRPSEGGFSADLATQVRPELRVDVKLALQRARQQGESTLTRPAAVEFDGDRRLVCVQVAPASDSEGAGGQTPGQAIVFFLDGGEAPEGPAPLRDEDVNREELVRLREELSAAQDRLNASRKEQEEATQELLGANEELQSLNEQYRSTTEELETSKEELQSLNEELQTLNSELKSKLEAISLAHADLQNLMAATEIGTLFLDAELRIRLFTPTVVKYFSIVEADIGRPISDFRNRLDYPALESEARRVLDDLVPIEHEVATRDGEWLLARIRPYRTLDRQTRGVVLTFAEVTPLKRAERELSQELEARSWLQDLGSVVYETGDPTAPYNEFLTAMMTLLESDFGSIQLLDKDRRVLRIVAHHGFNRGFLDHFALVDASRGSASGMALARGEQVAIGDVEMEPAFAESLGEARAAGFRAVISTPLRTTSGREIGMLTLHFRQPRTFSERDRRLARVGARRAADAIAVYLLMEELRADDRKKDEFIAALAHELRNPLAPLCNALEVLKRPGVSAAEAERLRAMMGRQATHLKRLVDDLLDISRITRGKIELRRQNVDLNLILRQAAESSAPFFGGRREIAFALSEEALPIDGDPVRLVQIFVNLLGNAAKYTPPEGRIEIGSRREGDFAVTSVRDDGAGIEPGLLPHIFEVFFQGARDANRPQDGLGIGLFLVKTLVGLHGGSIEAASEGPGTGSLFTVRLPLAAGGRRPEAAETAPPAPAPVVRRVLVVDDNQDVADSFALMLGQFDAEVRVEYSGAAALACLDAFRPDIVFVDLGMPGMGGYEVARRIRVRPGGSDIVLVAVSGWGRDRDRRASAEAGFVRHLVKPVDPAEIEALLAAPPRAKGDGNPA